MLKCVSGSRYRFTGTPPICALQPSRYNKSYVKGRSIHLSTLLIGCIPTKNFQVWKINTEMAAMNMSTMVLILVITTTYYSCTTLLKPLDKQNPHRLSPVMGQWLFI